MQHPQPAARNARATAATILHQLQEGRQTLDPLLNQAASRIDLLDRADRALLHALVYGVLRWQARLDWIIDQLAAKNRKMDPVVRILLRLGLFQILFLDRVPASAAVNTTVELAKDLNRQWAAGFINALLRRYLRHHDQVRWPDEKSDLALFLSIRHAMPRWLIKRWLEHWGRTDTEKLCEVINTPSPVTLRVNTLKTSREALKAAIAAEAGSIADTRFSPEGITLSHLWRPLPLWPAFEQGMFQVQGEAAQIVTHLLDLRPGQSVWDACAGLGTKTGHIAQRMANKGRIVASDLNSEKLTQLDAEMHRLGVTMVQIRRLDHTDPDKSFENERFDRIVLDAPCSGLGVLQKNPDGKWRLIPGDIEKNSQRQIRLLANVAPHLKPGGILVYTVCSLEPEENERVVESFLQKHPEFVIRPLDLKSIEESHRLLTPQGFLKTIPHQHQMDGFFAAALTLPGANAS